MPITQDNNDQSRSALDILAEGNIGDQLDEPETEQTEETKEPEKPTGVSLDEFNQFKDKFLETQQELQFLRGYLANNQQRDQTQQRDEEQEVQPLAVDYDAIQADIEKRGAVAVGELIEKHVNNALARYDQQNRRNVDQKFAQTSAAARRGSLFQNELNSITKDFAEYMGDDAFKKEIDEEARVFLETRIGRRWQSEDDSKYYQPGDLSSAVAKVALRWERAGKKPKGAEQTQTRQSSVREVVTRVGASENLGDGVGRNAGPIKTIDGLPMSEREKAAAKNVLKRTRATNPEITEERWVKAWLRSNSNREAA